MEKIEDLTPEQDLKLEEYYEKWLKIGLQTGTKKIDRQIAEENICLAYLNQGLKKPRIIWTKSPMEAANLCVDKGDNQANLVWNASYGHHDAGWLGFYDFMREELGLKEETEELVPLIAIAKHTGWWFPYENICIASDRPEEIHVNDADGNLHNFNGPAIRYADGFEMYMFNGIEVTKELAKIPADKITREMLTRETNADIRREMIRKIGNERLESVLQSEIIDRFEEYSLITFDIGDGRTRPHLKMTCPSTKHTHILGSRPEQHSALTGLAHLFDQDKYRRPIKEDGLDRGGDPAEFEDGQTLYRHGDVHFKKYSGPLGEPMKIQTKGVIHHGQNNDHAYASGKFEIRNVDGKKIVVIHEESTIDHNEHGRQTHPPGNYEVRIAREYDHWLEESRAVID